MAKSRKLSWLLFLLANCLALQVGAMGGSGFTINSGVSIGNVYESQISEYIISAKNNTTGANGDIEFLAGITMTVNFPAGTDATTITSGNFYKNSTKYSIAVATTATTASFTTPINIAWFNSFKIVLKGITNPSAANYTTLTVTVTNIAGGTNTYTNSYYSVYTNSPPATTAFQELAGDTNLWQNDWGYDIKQASDGGYVIAGTSSSFGSNQDIYLLKLDADGVLQWSKNFDYGNINQGFAMDKTTDGGNITAGYGPYITNNDFILIKTDASGTIEWDRAYHGYENDYPYHIRQIADGGYIVAGRSGSLSQRGVLMRMDGSGTLLWAKTYQQGNTNLYSVQETYGASGFIAVGSSGGAGYDYFVLRTDGSGNVTWSLTYGADGLTNPNDYGKAVLQTDDNADGFKDDGFMVAGVASAGTYLYLMKLDPSGSISWTRAYTIGMGSNGAGLYMDYTSDGGYIITGSTTLTNAGRDAFLMKFDQNWVFQWFRTYGNSGNDYSNSVAQTSDGGYILTGTTSYNASLPGFTDNNGTNIYVVKTDANGNCGCYEKTITPVVTTPTATLNSSAATVTVVGSSVSTSVTVTNPPSMVAGVCSAALLPVKLVTFEASVLKNKKVLLTWQTASELNNDYFAIERSVNTLDFQQVGTVPGAGNSSQSLHYQYTDQLSTNNYQPATTYYRLKQVDYDGQYTYSKTISVQVNKAGVNSVIHQTIDYLVISMDQIAEQEATIHIYDIMGRQVYYERFKGLQEHKISLNELKSGIYYFTLQSNNQIIATEKLAIQ